MVTELTGGDGVKAMIEDAPGHKLPLEGAIRVGIETSRGLELAHSRDIVHRDLKQGNVWLADDGIAKIGAFGLAVAPDRSRLTQRCNDTLTIASVVGRELELRHLDRLAEDQTEDMLPDVLEEGLNARVIEELPSSAGHCQFTHALIQETLSGELSLTRRVRLHGRVAEMLEELYDADAEPTPLNSLTTSSRPRPRRAGKSWRGTPCMLATAPWMSTPMRKQ